MGEQEVMDIETQVAMLKRRIADAAKGRAKAEHQLAVAQDRKAQAEKDLHEEFGVTPAEVPALAKALEDDLEAEAQRVEKLLEKAEGRSE